MRTHGSCETWNRDFHEENLQMCCYFSFSFEREVSRNLVGNTIPCGNGWDKWKLFCMDFDMNVWGCHKCFFGVLVNQPVSMLHLFGSNSSSRLDFSDRCKCPDCHWDLKTLLITKHYLQFILLVHDWIKRFKDKIHLKVEKTLTLQELEYSRFSWAFAPEVRIN